MSQGLGEICDHPSTIRQWARRLPFCFTFSSDIAQLSNKKLTEMWSFDTKATSFYNKFWVYLWIKWPVLKQLLARHIALAVCLQPIGRVSDLNWAERRRGAQRVPSLGVNCGLGAVARYRPVGNHIEPRL